jgi:phosphoribosylanthranilate isomerase
MRVKVCGITRTADARLARELGAAAVGFVFVPQSPRYIAPRLAGQIAEAVGTGIERVGVFADPSPEVVARAVIEAQLSVVQLHGAETPEMVSRLGLRVIKAVRASVPEDIERLAGFSVEGFLIDGPGGGTQADFALACAAKRYGPVWLAGGLHAGNLREALQAVRPHAVDLSSGLESAPGVKDARKMIEFFAAIRRCEEELGL